MTLINRRNALLWHFALNVFNFKTNLRLHEPQAVATPVCQRRYCLPKRPKESIGDLSLIYIYRPAEVEPQGCKPEKTASNIN